MTEETHEETVDLVKTSLKIRMSSLKERNNDLTRIIRNTRRVLVKMECGCTVNNLEIVCLRCEALTAIGARK